MSRGDDPAAPMSRGDDPAAPSSATGADGPSAAGAPAPPKLLVSVTDVRRHLGSREDVRRELVAEGLALPDVAVPDGAALVFDGHVESIAEGVVLAGEVAVPWVGSCRRCLREVSGVEAIDVQEIYAVHPVDGDTWPLEHDQIDLGPLLHDTALLALPLAPLCSAGCRGPSPEEFPTGVVDDAPRRDPRWAALDDLDLG